MQFWVLKEIPRASTIHTILRFPGYSALRLQLLPMFLKFHTQFVFADSAKHCAPETSNSYMHDSSWSFNTILSLCSINLVCLQGNIKERKTEYCVKVRIYAVTSLCPVICRGMAAGSESNVDFFLLEKIKKKTSTTPSCSGPMPAQKSWGNSVQ